MRHLRSLPLLLIFLLALLPAVALAEDPPTPPPDLPPPPPPCVDCWWPAAPVAALDRLEVRLDVSGGAISARYRLRLSNPAGGGIAEGQIVLPVPTGSSVTDLVLSGGPETLEGKLLDADDAQRIYQEIVARQIDPALLHSLGDNLYEVRAFPVPAGEHREVSFTVTTPLTAEGEQALVEIPWSRMSPRPASAVVSAEIDVPWELRSALAPGHDIAFTREDTGRATVDWESGHGWTPGADFRLYLTGGEGLLATRLLAHRSGEQDGYFALLFAPAIEVDEVVARDVILVLDTSGSMEGEKIEQAREAARYVLDHLSKDDRFGIVSFSRGVRVFDDELRPASEVGDAGDFVDGLEAAGGTNISGGLERALDLASGERPATVIFLTDGLPTEGIQETDGILDLAAQAAPERTQLFAFGVGYDVDTVLLDALSTRFTGSSHYVTPGEAVDAEVSRLFERVSTPVLTDVQVEIEGGDTYDMAPASMTGIFAGSQTLLTGRYETPGRVTVTVTGNSFEGEKRFTYDVTLPESDTADPTVAQLWAQRRVADLLTELRIEGERESLVEEIVAIATRFGIVTPYTAYLAQEPELAFSPQDAARSVQATASAAPASGEFAVDGASDLEELRDGRLELGGDAIRVIGDRSFYLVGDRWVQEGFEESVDAPEIRVGSPEFAALLEGSPDLATAAALGERVVTRGSAGWVTIVWPEAGASPAEVAPAPKLPVATATAPAAAPVALASASQESDGESGRWIAMGVVAVALVTLLTAGAVFLVRRRTPAHG